MSRVLIADEQTTKVPPARNVQPVVHSAAEGPGAHGDGRNVANVDSAVRRSLALTVAAPGDLL